MKRIILAIGIILMGLNGFSNPPIKLTFNSASNNVCVITIKDDNGVVLYTFTGALKNVNVSLDPKNGLNSYIVSDKPLTIKHTVNDGDEVIKEQTTTSNRAVFIDDLDYLK